MLLIYIIIKITDKMQKKSGERRVGLIRQTSAISSRLPHSIRDVTINNINLFNEMNELGRERLTIFERYEEIIKDLEQVIRNLQQKNQFINEERVKLIGENIRLRQELQSIKESYFMTDSCVKQVNLFDVVADDDTIVRIQKQHKKSQQILEQSQFDLMYSGHHFSQQVSAQISIQNVKQIRSECDQNLESQQKTPCLQNHYSLIQCRSSNNQAPLRIFYLLMLQEQMFIDKLRDLLKLCVQDQSKILLNLFPHNNELWGQIIENFLQSIIKGQFENQNDIIAYISENPLIDMLLISLLKQSLPVENENKDLNLGDWKKQHISHRALFQGLCNQFDLKLQQDRDNLIYRMYLNAYAQKSQADPSASLNHSQLEESNLLDSKVSQINQVVQISLLPKPTNRGTSYEQSRQQATFKIWIDPQRQYYRTNISIRPDKFSYNDDQSISHSFHATSNKNQQSQYQQQIEQCQKKRSILVPRDLNCIKKMKEKYSHQQDYLRMESKNLSKDNSYVCSEIGQ